MDAAGNARNILLSEHAKSAHEPRPGTRSRPSAHFGGIFRRADGTVHLTRRELEVLSLLAEGLPNKLICRRLGISAGTVKIHVSRVLAELGVSSRLEAVVVAQRLGILAVHIEAAEPPQHDPPDRLAGHARSNGGAPPLRIG